MDPLLVSEVTKEREDWEELLQTAGWKRFVAYATDRYQGGGYFNAMGQALRSGDQMKPLIFHETALEIMRVLNHPAATLQRFQESRL